MTSGRLLLFITDVLSSRVYSVPALAAASVLGMDDSFGRVFRKRQLTRLNG